MSQIVKPTTDGALIQAFLEKGGKIKKGKTKPFPADLQISKNHWGNKLTCLTSAPMGPNRVIC